MEKIENSRSMQCIPRSFAASTIAVFREAELTAFTVTESTPCLRSASVTVNVTRYVPAAAKSTGPGLIDVRIGDGSAEAPKIGQGRPAAQGRPLEIQGLPGGDRDVASGRRDVGRRGCAPTLARDGNGPRVRVRIPILVRGPEGHRGLPPPWGRQPARGLAGWNQPPRRRRSRGTRWVDPLRPQPL